ncbi:MAG TPA: hypothetical protein VEC99_13630 [Clostridia bacterium]|nr:hypothetical protein [Clostridia bacterium]
MSSLLMEFSANRAVPLASRSDVPMVAVRLSAHGLTAKKTGASRQ